MTSHVIIFDALMISPLGGAIRPNLEFIFIERLRPLNIYLFYTHKYYRRSILIFLFSLRVFLHKPTVCIYYRIK